MQAFQRDLDRFESLGAHVVGVSTDDLETHRRFAGEYDISFPLVSDAKGDLGRLYGGGRTTLVIDTSGVIRFIQKGVPDNKKLLRFLKRLSGA